MSSTFLNTTPFEWRRGEVQLPQRDAEAFASPTANHVGLQVSGERSPAFSLMLKKFAPGTQCDLELLKTLFRVLNGQVVQLRIDGVNHLLPQWGGYRFAIQESRIVDSGISPHISGYHDGRPFKYEPGSWVMANVTMYAVPG